MNAERLPVGLQRFLRSLRPRTRADRLQDDIFQRMPLEKKLRLVSDFYRFARSLSAPQRSDGTGRPSSKNRGAPR